MATRKSPSHPRDHDRARVSKALASVQPVRLGKLPKVSGRPRYEADIEIAAAIDRSFPAPTNGRKILKAGEEIVAALDRVMQSKLRTVQQRLPAPRTAERPARAPQGIETEKLSHNAGHVRARVRFPMQMFTESVNRIARELEDKESESAKLRSLNSNDEPRHVPTRFDKALDYGDGPILRWALSQYVHDQAIVSMRSTNPDGGKVDGAQSSHDRSPFNATQQKALARIAWVHQHISRSDRNDLQTFANMQERLQTNNEAVSMSEFARQRTGIADDKVREGCFIGMFWKVAERLNDIYKLRELPKALALALAA